MAGIGVDHYQRIRRARVAAASLESNDARIRLVRDPIARPGDVQIPMSERRVAPADLREPTHPLIERAILIVSARPEIFTVGRVVPAGKSLLGAVVDARDPVLGEDEEQRIL